jgi:SAM-dependent methyltransferase
VPPRNYFDREVATRYDESASAMFDPTVVEPVVDFLVERSRGGKVLEFGIGTGRIALPLAGRGVTVSGIDLSQPMLDELAEKPGSEEIDVMVGDFATTQVPGSFYLVYSVFNTIMNLTSQAAQVSCFRNASDHLEPGGMFVIEVVMPDLRRLPPGQSHVVFRADETGWGVDEYDVVEQSLVSHHMERTEEGVREFSLPFRYVWPAELDLMAEMAGMRRVERYSDWQGSPFTAESRQQVSVWVKG